MKTGFDKVVRPQPIPMAYVVVFSELAIGLGLVLGFLTPIAAWWPASCSTSSTSCS